MAVLTGIPGLKVTIESNGQPLTEYEDKDGDCDSWVGDRGLSSAPGHRVSKFVESQIGSEFGVQIEIPHFLESSTEGPDNDFNNFAFWVSVDRKEIGGQIASRLGPWPSQLFIDRTAERVSNTHVARRALKFSAISKVDGVDAQRVEQDAKSIEGLGEIVVFLHRMKITRICDSIASTKALHGEVAEVAEKALKGKAVSLSVSFGEASMEPNTQYFHDYPDGSKNPMGSFRFKYRSRADLQSELILPRSESPDALSSPLAEQDQQSTNVQMPSRERRLAELKKEIADIKAEGLEGADGQYFGGVKREHSFKDEALRSTRTFKSFQGEDGNTVVDLTDD